MKGEVRTTEIVLLAILVSAVQIPVSTYLRPLLYADLTLACVLYLAWRTVPIRAITAGCALGLLQDICLLMPYWGMNGLSKTVAAFLGVSLSRRIWLESPISRFLSIAMFAALDTLISFSVLTLLGRHGPFGGWTGLVSKALLTGVAGVLLFHFSDRIRIPVKSFRQHS